MCPLWCLKPRQYHFNGFDAFFFSCLINRFYLRKIIATIMVWYLRQTSTNRGWFGHIFNLEKWPPIIVISSFFLHTPLYRKKNKTKISDLAIMQNYIVERGKYIGPAPLWGVKCVVVYTNKGMKFLIWKWHHLHIIFVPNYSNVMYKCGTNKHVTFTYVNDCKPTTPKWK